VLYLLDCALELEQRQSVLVKVKRQGSVHTQDHKSACYWEDLLPLLTLQVGKEEEGGKQATEEASHVRPCRAASRGGGGTHDKVHQERQHEQPPQQRSANRKEPKPRYVLWLFCLLPGGKNQVL
jgi:hypothetical protein